MKLMIQEFAAAMMLLSGVAAQAAPETMPLTPGNMRAETHSHAMIMTVTGTYRQLTGTLMFDPATKACRIDVTFTVASLSSPNALIHAQVMSKDFLDPADYPLTHYAATCQGGRLVGQLTLHGQTHAFDMSLTYTGAGAEITAIHAAGAFDRYDWGLTGHAMTIGKMIGVTNDISLNGEAP